MIRQFSTMKQSLFNIKGIEIKNLNSTEIIDEIEILDATKFGTL